MNLRILQEKFCGGIYPYVVHSADSIEHIFGIGNYLLDYRNRLQQ